MVFGRCDISNVFQCFCRCDKNVCRQFHFCHNSFSLASLDEMGMRRKTARDRSTRFVVESSWLVVRQWHCPTEHIHSLHDTRGPWNASRRRIILNANADINDISFILSHFNKWMNGARGKMMKMFTRNALMCVNSMCLWKWNVEWQTEVKCDFSPVWVWRRSAYKTVEMSAT